MGYADRAMVLRKFYALLSFRCMEMRRKMYIGSKKRNG